MYGVILHYSGVIWRISEVHPIKNKKNDKINVHITILHNLIFLIPMGKCQCNPVNENHLCKKESCKASEGRHTILAKEHRVQKPMCSKIMKCTTCMHTHASIFKMPWESKDLALWSALLSSAGLAMLCLPCPLAQMKKGFECFLWGATVGQGQLIHEATYPISKKVSGQKEWINPQYDKKKNNNNKKKKRNK